MTLNIVMEETHAISHAERGMLHTVPNAMPVTPLF